MEPTNRLRWFVKRFAVQVDAVDRRNGSWSREHRVTVLQQLWVDGDKTEWRELPTEESAVDTSSIKG